MIKRITPKQPCCSFSFPSLLLPFHAQMIPLKMDPRTIRIPIGLSISSVKYIPRGKRITAKHPKLEPPFGMLSSERVFDSGSCSPFEFSGFGFSFFIKARKWFLKTFCC